MSVATVIKEVFFVLAMMILAVTLYNVLCSYPDGALWVISNNIQAPIAQYYYEYCYLPNIHENDAVDSALGCHVLYSVTNTPTNHTTTVAYPANNFYTTGWK